jgi:phosphate transport system substrate-binding protein
MRGMGATSFCTMALVLVAGLSGCGRSGSGDAIGGKLAIKGSDTMVLLVSDWAEAFMHSRPDLRVSVTGGGSGTGIKGFINGTTAIAASSRDMTPEEVEQARRAGRVPNAVPVARDAIVIVVNPSNRLTEITVEQLRRVYTGQYTNWSELGGDDEPIVALSRESSSGTFLFFQEHVMNKEDYAPSVRPLTATQGIIQGVASDRGAIGYAGLGHALSAGVRVKILPVKQTPDAPAVMPTEQSVRSGEYAIGRPLLLILEEGAGGSAKAFLDFALSQQGQQIVRENEYITIQ